jgi:adenosylcobyric acid synthase
MGTTRRGADLPAVIHFSSGGGIDEEDDGARARDGRIWGTYLHGLFDLPAFRRSFLTGLRPDLIAPEQESAAVPASAFRDRQYDLLAAHFKEHLDVARLISIIDPEGELAIARRATGGDG